MNNLIDWTKSMAQTFEYYLVDPVTWRDKKLLRKVTSSNITRDNASDLIISGSIETDEIYAEEYVRIYLVITQNNEVHKEPLATLLMQAPSATVNGKFKRCQSDGYSPLLELRDDNPDLGFTLPKNSNILDTVFLNTSSKCRAPIPTITFPVKTLYDDFVANADDSWLTFNKDLLAQAKHHYEVDAMGNILIAEDVKFESLRPVWKFTDDNSSILLPDVTITRDLYGIPNRVEVVCSTSSGYLMSVVENNDAKSPTSIQSRGRTILYRETDPSISGTPTQTILDDYAKQKLKDLSTITNTVSFSHGYCPARVGDAVELTYKVAGLDKVIAQIQSQTIDCRTGCKVTSTAAYLERLW